MQKILKNYLTKENIEKFKKMILQKEFCFRNFKKMKNYFVKKFFWKSEDV